MECKKFHKYFQKTCPYCGSSKVGYVEEDIPNVGKELVFGAVLAYFAISTGYEVYGVFGALGGSAILGLLAWLGINLHKGRKEELYKKVKRRFEEEKEAYTEKQKSFGRQYQGEYSVISYEKYITGCDFTCKIIAEKNGIVYTFDNGLHVKLDENVKNVNGAYLYIDELGYGVIKVGERNEEFEELNILDYLGND